ncbi:hypothetical protein C8J57DRAFT_1496286 [Mycena rebaudengoi]|nr:hypothetical protein C8J57DRAFT_1496286 [Mycena rebaudengoi]
MLERVSPPAKPSRAGWVHGTKLPFFEAHKDDYLAASTLDEAGKFYDRVAQSYLKKYGYHMARDGDLPEDTDIADDVDEDEDINSLPAEEAGERSYMADLSQKIGVWYRAQYGSAQKKKKKHQGSFKQLFDRMELEPPAPIHPRILHYYSWRYWEDFITVRNLVTVEAWRGEIEPFKAEVAAALELEHSMAWAAYESVISGEALTTPEGFDLALNNATHYLQPFVEAIRERFGMNMQQSVALVHPPQRPPLLLARPGGSNTPSEGGGEGETPRPNPISPTDDMNDPPPPPPEDTPPAPEDTPPPPEDTPPPPEDTPPPPDYTPPSPKDAAISAAELARHCERPMDDGLHAELDCLDEEAYERRLVELDGMEDEEFLQKASRHSWIA